jgi:uncharacterized protein
MLVRCLALAALLLAAACHSEPVAGDRSMAHTRAGDIELTGRVIDRAEVIPAANEAQLNGRLAALEKDTADQLVLVTLPSLKGATIEQIGRSLGNGWGIGRADVDNGVLLIVAPSERKVRIEVGLGLEGLLTDQRAAQIIAKMLPSFRRNQPTEAIAIGVNEITAVLGADKRRPHRLTLRRAA